MAEGRLYMVFEHDGSLGPRETEYLGPFPDFVAAVAHCMKWGGLHGKPTELDVIPPAEYTMSPEEHAKRQEQRM